MTQTLLTSNIPDFEKTNHYAVLTEAVNAQLGEYKDHRSGQQNLTPEDFMTYMEAKYDLIGFTDVKPCDAITWLAMDSAQDPFVKSLMKFVRAEYEMTPSQVEIDDKLVLALFNLATSPVAALPREVIDRSTRPQELIRKFQIVNSMILTMAKALDVDKSLMHANTEEDYMELGASYASLTVAARICRRLFGSYPIEFVGKNKEVQL